MLDKIAAMKERDDATTQFRLTAARLRAINADLLAALEDANKLLWQEGFTTSQPEIVKIEAAIAKARGE